MTVMLPHASYKPSTAPWIGQIPAHWDEKPLFALARERRESNAGMRENNLLSLSYGRIVRKDINTNQGLLPESFETYQIVEAGDVVFRLTDLQNDQRSLRSALCGERGIITSAYTAVAIDGATPDFFSYLMRAYDVQKVFYSMGGGLRQSLKYEDLRRMPVLLPSTPEQEAIVAFLDRETERIDHLIEKKVRFIEILREKRLALVAHTALRGLHTDTPTKSVSAGWIGTIPSSWNEKPLFSVARERRVSNTGMRENNLLSLSYGRIVRKDINKSEGLLPNSFETYQIVEPGDVVFRLTDLQNDQRSLRSALVVERGIITSAYIAIIPEGISPPFFSYLMRAYDVWKVFYSMGGGLRQSLKYDDLRRLPILIPSEEEQGHIVSFLDRETARIDSLVAKTVRSIELLKEHRSALITAAVTGKIDVRGLAAKKMKAAA